jgi:hypothetical protein
MIVAVLVVPAEGDPGGLLARGGCEARPPLVHRRIALITDPAYTWLNGWRTQGSIASDVESALPLWWDGALVPEGWDRARRVYAASCADHPDVIADRAYDTPSPGMQRLLALADMLVSHGLVASRVVRLTRDADGRLVEVP